MGGRLRRVEKWISSLFPAKTEPLINGRSIVNERVGKWATSTDPVFLIAQRKDNQSQTVPSPTPHPFPPPAAESQREHAGRGNQNLLTLQVLQDNNRTWQPPGTLKKTPDQASQPESNLPVVLERHEVAPPIAVCLISLHAFLRSRSPLEACTLAGELMQMSACEKALNASCCHECVSETADRWRLRVGLKRQLHRTELLFPPSASLNVSKL